MKMNMKKWASITLLISFLMMLVVPICVRPAKAQSPATVNLTWPISIGDEAVYWANTTGTDMFLKMHILDINVTKGTYWSECIWGTSYQWNKSTSVWDLQYDGLINKWSTQNNTWQVLTAIAGTPMGYPAAFTGDFPGISGFHALMGASVNMTWLNTSYYLKNVVDPFFNSTLNGNTWTMTNMSNGVIVRQIVMGSTGFLLSVIMNNAATGNLELRENYVAPPVITLNSPAEQATVKSGDHISCAVTAGINASIASIKHFWSKNTDTPDWNSQGIAITDPTNILFNTYLGSGVVYLHMFAVDNLGQSSSFTFSFEMEETGIPGYPLIALGMIFAITLYMKIHLTLRQKTLR